MSLRLSAVIGTFVSRRQAAMPCAISEAGAPPKLLHADEDFILMFRVPPFFSFPETHYGFGCFILIERCGDRARDMITFEAGRCDERGQDIGTGKFRPDARHDGMMM